MPKKTKPDIVIRVHQLGQQGNTISAILERIGSEFGEALVPEASTVSRILKRQPPEDVAEDQPFTWGSMTGLPWEQSRVILDIWAFYIGSGYEQSVGPFTRRFAKWTWRVINAIGPAHDVPDDVRVYPQRSDIIFVALEYAWREARSQILHEAFDTADLDLWLAMTPWMEEQSMEDYRTAKFQGTTEFTPIKWLQPASPVATNKVEEHLASIAKPSSPQ